MDQCYYNIWLISRSTYRSSETCLAQAVLSFGKSLASVELSLAYHTSPRLAILVDLVQTASSSLVIVERSGQIEATVSNKVDLPPSQILGVDILHARYPSHGLPYRFIHSKPLL